MNNERSLHNIDYITPIQGNNLDMRECMYKYAGLMGFYAKMMNAGATGRKAHVGAGVGVCPESESRAQRS